MASLIVYEGSGPSGGNSKHRHVKEMRMGDPRFSRSSVRLGPKCNGENKYMAKFSDE